MKIYTFARKKAENCGHGGGIDIEVIQRSGDYGTGDFYPCFVSEEKAKEYLKTKPIYGLHIVELNLIEDTE